MYISNNANPFFYLYAVTTHKYVVYNMVHNLVETTFFNNAFIILLEIQVRLEIIISIRYVREYTNITYLTFAQTLEKNLVNFLTNVFFVFQVSGVSIHLFVW